jgi:hypothetical protein
LTTRVKRESALGEVQEPKDVWCAFGGLTKELVGLPVETRVVALGSL